MSTSDQHGGRPLTRKQLRELRLTGATPVIGEEEAAAAAQQTPQPPAPALARPAEPAPIPPAPEDAPDDPSAPLTRRQARAQERVRAVPTPAVVPEAERELKPAEPSGQPAARPNADVAEQTIDEAEFAPVPAQSATGTAKPTESVSEDAETRFEEDVDAEADEFSTVFGVSREQAEQDDEDQDAEGDELPVADAVITGERPTVNPAFGTQLLGGQPNVPEFAPSFDELVGSDSAGSHRAPNTLIFTHPGEGSLSGPVASTGELLITGSYELPRGLGSRGHADGAADGKDVDAVLIDGELPPASSPTPIAASSAVSTIKPAGEVIRPPAPEKGNKLMLTLAITAGGLALALAVALIVAFTTNVFG